MNKTEISYTYSLFVTDDGEISTGFSDGESVDAAASWLKSVFEAEVCAVLEKNPNRIISFVVVTKVQDSEGETT